MEEIKQNKGNDIKVVIVGNKSDMKENRKIQPEEGMKIAKENNASFIEVSAKSGENIALMFQNIANSLVGKDQPTADEVPAQDNAPQTPPPADSHKGIQLQNPVSSEGEAYGAPKVRKCC